MDQVTYYAILTLIGIKMWALICLMLLESISEDGTLTYLDWKTRFIVIALTPLLLIMGLIMYYVVVLLAPLILIIKYLFEK